MIEILVERLAPKPVIFLYIVVTMSVPTRPGETEAAAQGEIHSPPPAEAAPAPKAKAMPVPAAATVFHPPTPKLKTSRKLMRQTELVDRGKGL